MAFGMHNDIIQQGFFAYFVGAGADMEAAADEDSASPLNFAVGYGHIAVVRFLLESGADKQSQMKHGQTPLVLAALNGFPSIVQCLLKAGAKYDRVKVTLTSPNFSAQRKGVLFSARSDVFLDSFYCVAVSAYYLQNNMRKLELTKFSAIQFCLLTLGQCCKGALSTGCTDI